MKAPCDMPVSLPAGLLGRGRQQARSAPKQRQALKPPGWCCALAAQATLVLRQAGVFFRCCMPSNTVGLKAAMRVAGRHKTRCFMPACFFYRCDLENGADAKATCVSPTGCQLAPLDSHFPCVAGTSFLSFPEVVSWGGCRVCATGRGEEGAEGNVFA